MTKKPAAHNRKWTRQSVMVLIIIILVFYATAMTILTFLINGQLQKTENNLDNTSLSYELLKDNSVKK